MSKPIPFTVHVVPEGPGFPKPKVLEPSRNMQRLAALADSLKPRTTTVLVEEAGKLVPKPVEVRPKFNQPKAIVVQLETTRELGVHPETGEIAVKEHLNNQAPSWLRLIPVFGRNGEVVAILDSKGRAVRLAP